LRLSAPAALSIAAGHIRVGEARMSIAEGNVHLAEFAWDDGRITTSGRFTQVPVAAVARLAGTPLPFVSTLTLIGEWSLTAAPRINGTLNLRREGGDVWIMRDAAIDSTKTALGITALEVDARFADDAVDATATFRSTRGGAADVRLAIGALANAAPGRIAPDAPLALTVSAQLPTLQLLQPWIGTVAVIDGRARVDLAAKGTMKSAPLAGTLTGEGIRLDAPRYGLHFTDGRVSARFADRGLVLDDLSLTAGAGVFHATGTIAAATDGARTPAAHLTWRADKFRLFNRPERNLVVSGEGTIASVNGKVTLAGSLRADEGRIVYEAEPGATLGDDVVVKGWPRQTADASRATDVPLGIDLKLDFGDRLTFTGMGLDTGLRGEVHVANGSGGLVGKGSIRTVNGTYFAYGQRLVIDPGRLVFDGPLDNPGLDIVALRRNLAVEAGVAVTGTVKVPNIQLTSNPPVPDAEKLSWLVLGRGLDRTSGADIAALQAASAALLGRNSRPVTATIAQNLGLDDISFKNAAGSSRGAQGAEGQVVSVGKRLSENLAIVYEQGLTVATNALRLEYSLTGSLTLRAEAGTVSGVGVYFRRNFD
jgi:translocation and assembly module TamB